MIIDKMSGCIVHGAREPGDDLTLIQQLRDDFSSTSLYPTHRLDKDTSGLMIIAKNPETNSLISAAFESKSISKTYLALSDKKPKKKQGSIRGDMAKSRNGSWKLTRDMSNPAITYFQSSYLPEMDKRLFMLKPRTGKTHQLRVALKSLGAPILGDKRYKGTDADRMYLHAYSLQFTLQSQHFDFNILPTEGEMFLEQEFKLGIDFLVKKYP